MDGIYLMDRLAESVAHFTRGAGPSRHDGQIFCNQGNIKAFVHM